jgi:hypothetical protein
MERKNLTVVRLEFYGRSASREFVANYNYGKQERTKTRKEKAEARKAQARELYPTRPSCHHTITQKQLKKFAAGQISVGRPTMAHRAMPIYGQSDCAIRQRDRSGKKRAIFTWKGLPRIAGALSAGNSDDVQIIITSATLF